MKDTATVQRLRLLAAEYNDEKYFGQDPIIFPKAMMKRGGTLQDIEITAAIAAHLAWGRRPMILRDCERALQEMQWQPYSYIRSGCFRQGKESLHRTVRWDDFAMICRNLKRFYDSEPSLEILSTDEFRTRIYGQKEDRNAANKKIWMLKRWMVRNDGIVDLGLWKNSSPADLVIPLDVHVHRSALEMGLTGRQSASAATAREITDYLKKVFPGDPCLGDFALFAYSATTKNKKEDNTK